MPHTGTERISPTRVAVPSLEYDGAPVILRPDLLANQAIAIAAIDGPFGRVAADRCRALGARVAGLALEPDDEEAVAAAVGELGEIDTLVVDASATTSVRTALDGAWLVMRAVVNAAFMPGDRGGRIVLISPAPGDADAEATRGGLENMARTTSIEWSRYRVRPTAIAPGPHTSAAEVAELAAFIASAAGDYYSGCRFDLGALPLASGAG